MWKRIINIHRLLVEMPVCKLRVKIPQTNILNNFGIYIFSFIIYQYNLHTKLTNLVLKNKKINA